MEKLSLYYPVKPTRFNQHFGENANKFYAQQGMKGHNGIDFFAIHGQPIYATHDGVCFPEIDGAGGNGVVLKSLKTYDYNGTPTYFKTIYWHMIQDDAVVHTGQQVKAGDLLGYADSTGNSTGDHLHLGLKPCYMNELDGSWANVDQNNGYYGAIDPEPYLNGKFAQDISYTFTKLLKLKSWNEDVKHLQDVLRAQGLYTSASDGVFGPKTLLAVKQFQSAHNLDVDGIVGQATNKILNSIK